MPTALPISPFLTHDGLRLHQRDWPLPRPRARLLLVHGLGEHSGRYARLAEELNAAGIAVRAYDHRGHGRSDGARGCLDDPARLPRDTVSVFNAYAAEGGDLPFLFGHSMGGLVALHAVLLQDLVPRGLIASSPALATHAGGIQRAFARGLAGWWPDLTLRIGLDADRLSHDPHVEREYREDPLNHSRISTRLAHFIFSGGRQVIARAPELRTPTLLQFAADDHLVDPAGSRAFAAAAPQRKLRAHEYLRLYHEIYNEADPERSRVVADLLRWLDLQLDRPKRGHEG